MAKRPYHLPDDEVIDNLTRLPFMQANTSNKIQPSPQIKFPGSTLYPHKNVTVFPTGLFHLLTTRTHTSCLCITLIKKTKKKETQKTC